MEGNAKAARSPGAAVHRERKVPMTTPQTRLHVLYASLCDKMQRPAGDPAGMDLLGTRDALELPAKGPLYLKGWLALKFCRALVLTESSVGVPADALTVELVVRFIAPSGAALAPPHKRTVQFSSREALARERIDLRGLKTEDFGMHAFEVTANGEVLTIVPVLVIPHGMLKAGPAPTFH